MRLNYLIRLFGIAVLISACSTVKEARKVQNAEILPPGERIIKASEIGLDKNTVLTLEKALEITLKYNPNVTQATNRLDSAQLQLQSKKGSYYPQISVSTGAQKSENKSSDSTSYSRSISLSQYLYDFDKTDSQVRIYFYDALASEYDFKQAVNNATFSVKESYYNVLRQISAVRLAEETVRQNEKYLEQAKAYFEVGTKIKYDITKAEVNLGNAYLNLINARNTLFVNKQILNNVMGLSGNADYLLEELPDNLTFTGANTVDTEHIFATAKTDNPEIKAQEARVKSAGASVDSAIAALWPSLSLSGSYNFSGSDFPLSWTRALSAALSLDIFKGGQKSQAIKSATSNLKSARSSLTAVEQRIFLDITKAKNQMLDASQKLEINKKIMQQAEENLNFIEQRYKLGKASSVELTDAQVSFTRARENIIQSQFDYLIARATLEKIVPGDNN